MNITMREYGNNFSDGKTLCCAGCGRATLCVHSAALTELRQNQKRMLLFALILPSACVRFTCYLQKGILKNSYDML